MNLFDQRLIEAMSRTAIHAPSVTHAVEAVSRMYLFKGTILVALLWVIWFRHEFGEAFGHKPGRLDPASAELAAIRRRERELVVVAIVGGFIAFAAGRLLAHYLPFRLRPVYEPQLKGVYPTTAVDELLPRTWSAFPSDHAMLWGAIAMTIFFASRWLGIYALIHTVVLIGLPRIYLGLHYPSDVLAGGVLGIAIACVMCIDPIRVRVAKPVLFVAERWPGPFYGVSFVLSFALASQFDEFRILAHSAAVAM